MLLDRIYRRNRKGRLGTLQFVGAKAAYHQAALVLFFGFSDSFLVFGTVLDGRASDHHVVFGGAIAVDDDGAQIERKPRWCSS